MVSSAMQTEEIGNVQGHVVLAVAFPPKTKVI